MTDITKAQTILQQLGGKRFITMTGANTFTGSENALTFKIGTNASKGNRIRITLTPMDVYTVEVFKIRGMKCQTVKTVENVYADNLRSVFTGITGLYTSLN